MKTLKTGDAGQKNPLKPADGLSAMLRSSLVWGRMKANSGLKSSTGTRHAPPTGIRQYPGVVPAAPMGLVQV